MPPSVAIFDVNETLSDLTPLADRFAAVGAPRHLLATWFAATLRDGIALAAAGAYADFRDVGRSVLLSLLPSPDEAAADEILAGFATLSVHPDVPDGLRRLRDAGVRIATLTNGAASIPEQLLKRAGLSELVERNLSVSEVGRWKPAPEPYRHACRTLGVSAAEAVMIAVHPWDVDGAQRAGLRGAWLDRERTPYPTTFRQPDVTGHDLPALVDALLEV